MNVVPRVSKSHLQISGREISLPPRVFPSHHNKKEASHLAELRAWRLCHGNPCVTHAHTHTLHTNESQSYCAGLYLDLLEGDFNLLLSV